jgi:sulfate adenylyltransferase
MEQSRDRKRKIPISQNNNGHRGKLTAPYGTELVNLCVTGQERETLIHRAEELSSVQLSPRPMCDLVLLATGSFSPLDRFVGK